MNKINENPDRYVLEKTVTERVLFKKKEFVRYALGDENQNPLTEYIFKEIEDFDGGYFTVYFPHVKPIELSHMQTSSEAFTGDGLMDLKDAKKVKLNENFEML